MGIHADGATHCNRCNKALAGAGVLYGLVVNDLTPTGDVRWLIFCYDPVNRCRDAVLAGHLTYAQAGPTPSSARSCEPASGSAALTGCAADWR